MKHLRTAVFLAAFLCAALRCAPAAEAVTGADRLETLNRLSEIIALHALDSESEWPLGDALAALIDENPALFDKLVAAMYEDLDEYSHYLTREEFERQYPTGQPFVGVGIQVDAARGPGLYIDMVRADGPAAEAGLRAADHIVRIDGVDVSLFPWQAAAELLRGEEGTPVTLGVRRADETEERAFTVVRAALQASNVSYTDLGDGVGYFSISGFGTLEDFASFTATYRRIPYEGIRSVIIDLRDNGGGDTEVMYNMLNAMIPTQGEILFAVEGKNRLPELFTSTGAGQWTPNRVVVLVNEFTASAAEIFAGSLQDLELATLVGARTYGKGRGQYVFNLRDDSVAIVTALRALLPKRMAYDGEGVAPDIPVPGRQCRPYEETFAPLSADAAVLPTARSARVLGVEQRLALLGFFHGTPDETFDDYTRWALGLFQKQHRLTALSYAGVDTLRALLTETERQLERGRPFDAPYEEALELARAAAEKPLVAPLPPLWPGESDN
ncbi:MAG: PDZ domain-containing protein [Oscillospiraceae bacterium]|jgi:carboxyl-terminal processing protease|nr:PDZ domain-containing protein [Oscillospiraceae bacterium]